MQVKTLDIIKQRLINLNANEELSVEGHVDGSVVILGKTGTVLLVLSSDMTVSLSKALMTVRRKMGKQKEKQANV
jgi:hypothetical protein